MSKAAGKRKPRRHTHGFMLLLVVLSIVAIGGIVFLSGIGGGRNKAERAQAAQSSTNRVLSQSKDAMFGFLLGPPGGSVRLGQMPLPDSFENGKYDGVSDSHCLDGSQPNGIPAQLGSGVNYRCLGRLPWKTIGLPSDANDEFDSLGVIPWYSVSANLADPNTGCLAALNSGILSQVYTTFGCGNATQLPYPWLKVCDDSGRILSDRVAFVLIYPDEPITTGGRIQLRNRSPRPNPSDYLDAIALPQGWGSLPPSQRCTGYDNSGLTNEFVQAPLTATFNDRLVYVTIDELMAEIEKRVATEVREALITFRDVKASGTTATFDSYPWLAPLNDIDAPTATVAIPGTKSGFFPYHQRGAGFVTGFTWDVAKNYDLASGSSGWTTATWACTGQHLGVPFATSCRIASNTIDASAMNVYAASQTVGETGTCAWTNGTTLNARLGVIDCVYLTLPISSSVSLPYEIRNFSGYWVAAGLVTGNRTRSAKIQILSTQGAWTVVKAGASTMLTRTVKTTASAVIDDDVAVEDRFTGTAPEGAILNGLVGRGRTIGQGLVTVNGVRVYPEMPDWYTSEQWYKYIYVALAPGVSPDAPGKTCVTALGICFLSGVRGDIDAVVISAGKPILTQNRKRLPTPNAGDFLELKNSTAIAGPSNQNIFEASNIPKSALYEDTVVTIPR